MSTAHTVGVLEPDDLNPCSKTSFLVDYRTQTVPNSPAAGHISQFDLHTQYPRRSLTDGT